MQLDPPIPVLNAGINYWGEATSTIDWCEENYVACKYIAEFWNTTTNLVFFALALFGMYKVRSTKQENRFLLCYMAMLVVGIGSWLFHMTLQYQWQLADELPMVYGTCICVYCALRADVKVGSDIYVSLALFAYSTVVTLVYVQIRKPVFHQIAYGMEVFCILYLNMKHQIELRKTNWRAYSELMQLLWVGVSSFGMAFVLWNIDNIFCGNLRAIRNAVPALLSPFFQLHAYWHIGTALGCYVSIVYQQYLRLVKLDTVDEYRLRRLAFVVPYIDKAVKAL
ncbi:hypothetical protein GGI25_000635 [Coemansia spiralis]|uniref:Alkaline phytoceramidase n=2 Tax=Coemansia TaxID=4863 RepID=A0A9W8GE64_9FUNG|nr:ceramidase [Coemansia spiralis]KAJ1995656.1 hypothetical protein EDC05_000590 [Coemansia umbellata]KAJ2623738.1 hypothetical protein GGI26_002185 [Coemansia sp. RSA 1358]KAJ2680343.1 hypothetical protein GGI25_000635 [Coemansia spiralis]